MALLNDGLQVRALREEDADRVAELYERMHRGDPTVGRLSADAWRRFVAQPLNRGGRDFRVAELGGELVALATSSLRDREQPPVRHFRIMVDPAHRRKGIGSSLLESLVEMDPEGAGILLQALCPKEWSAGAAFLSARGFQCVEQEIEMSCKALALAPTTCGEDVTVERVSEPAAFGEEVARIHNLAYAGTLSFVSYTGEEMSRLLASGSELWIASAEGRVIGFCHLEPEADTVWLESVAVDPAWQGRKIGLCLTSQALSAAGVGAGRVAWLTVTDTNTAARAMYRRLGFTDTHVTQRFRARREDVASRPSRGP